MFLQLPTSWILRFIFGHPLSQWLTERKKEEKTKIHRWVKKWKRADSSFKLKLLIGVLKSFARRCLEFKNSKGVSYKFNSRLATFIFWIFQNISKVLMNQLPTQCLSSNCCFHILLLSSKMIRIAKLGPSLCCNE